MGPNKPRNGMILQIDHVIPDKTNNRIDNLQLLSQRENTSKGYIQNGKKTSQFTGISWHKQNKKWIAHIQINKKLKHLGYFTDEYNAHLVYQKALGELL